GLALVAGLGLWTLAPYGGCSCENPMGGNAGSGANQIYGGLEAGKVPINLVDDFNDGSSAASPTGHWQNEYTNGILTQVWFNGSDPALRINFWGGGTYSQADAFGSQYYSQLDKPGQPNITGAPTLGTTASLQYGCPTCPYGRTSVYVPSGGSSCGQEYPFVEHGLYLSPQNSGGDACVEFTGACPGPTCLATAQGDNTTLGSHGLEFFLAPGYNNVLMVKLIPLYLYNYSNANPCNSDGYAYYQYAIPGSTSGDIHIPFTAFVLASHGNATSGGQPIGTNLMWGALNGGKLNATTADGLNYTAMVDGNGNETNSLRFMAIQFDPNANIGSLLQEQYEFSIDNVEFY
ncbi:MAG: hypothetical protein ACREKE_00200, partial [bacterium]